MVTAVGGGADLAAAAIGRFDAFYDAFPKGKRLRSPAILAEILVFHALKCSGRPFDHARFRAASPVGDMAMGARRWLLEYRQFFPIPTILSNPRMQAAIATVAAARELGHEKISGTLREMGNYGISSVYNAAKHAWLGDLVHAHRGAPAVGQANARERATT